jgi:PAS domain S-box-containing protein
VLIDNVPAAMFMKDRDGRYQLINREFERMTGLDRQRVLGATAEDIYPPEVAQQIRANDQRALAADTPVQAEELIPDGPRQRTYLNVRFQLTDSDNTYALCGVATDITDRVQLAAEREQLQRQLHRAERLDTLGQLAGGIAHDFNNLLASIMGRAELLRDSDAGDLTADIDAMVGAAERGASLTRQLLTFSKAEPAQAEIIDINPVVRRAAQELQKTQPPHIHLVTRLAPDLPTTRIDPNQLEQVITNLVDNARAAMPDGGRLTIETAHAATAPDRPADPGAPTGGSVRLTVTDTGCGMPPEVAERAFEPFFTTRHGATGLGLATVYGVATQAGGDVTLWSRPEGGTIVQLHLPIVAVPRADATPVPTAHDGRCRTILVVDDEDDVRDIVRRILSKQGYDVLTAASGTEALHLWQHPGRHIDALLTDLVMPGLSGYQLAQHIRNDRPELPVLYMSGYTADTLPNDRGGSPDTPLLHKPFDRATLLNRLREILDRGDDSAESFAGTPSQHRGQHQHRSPG